MNGIPEHFGNERCMIELEFSVDYIKVLNDMAKLLGLVNHKEVINLAISHFSECEKSPIKDVGKSRGHRCYIE